MGRRAVRAVVFLAGLAAAMQPVLPAQTLARPGWAGSGLKVTAWWRNAVLFEVSPASFAVAPGQAAAVNELADLMGRLDDLQALGADAVLLRGVDREGAAGAGRVTESYGTLDQLDDLLREAGRRRIRVLVELPGSLGGDVLRAAARFWLSRGVSGVFLSSAADGVQTGAVLPRSSGGASASSVIAPDPAAGQAAMLREVLRGYAGERVLLVGETGAGGEAPGGAEMTSVLLRGFVAGQATDVAAVRQSLLAARAAAGGRRGGTVARIDSEAGLASGAAAEARASVLLMIAGGVALRTSEAGEGPGAQAMAASRAQEAKDQAALAAATSPAGVSNVKRAIAARAGVEPPRFAGDEVFRWTERMIGLHRGNAAMLEGEQMLLDRDSQGAIVSVWRGRAGQVLCEVVNLRDAPVEISLAQDFAGMHVHGSFLKPVARTDAGMGAMPLARVKLPGYGVFLGELGR